MSSNRNMPILGAEESAPSIEPKPENKVLEPKPNFKVAEASSMKMVPEKSGPIEVVAIRVGFYNGSRRVEGDVFNIASIEKLGSWMKLSDPKLEAKRKEDMKARKELEKKAGI